MSSTHYRVTVMVPSVFEGCQKVEYIKAIRCLTGQGLKKVVEDIGAYQGGSLEFHVWNVPDQTNAFCQALYANGIEYQVEDVHSGVFFRNGETVYNYVEPTVEDVIVSVDDSSATQQLEQAALAFIKEKKYNLAIEVLNILNNI